MPGITVGLPAEFTSPHPAREMACDASTVGEALRAVADEAPEYAQRIFYRDHLLVAVLLNGVHLQPATVRETTLASGDRIDLMPPVAGG